MKKAKKDSILNVEHHAHGNSVLDVTTRKDRYGQLYYVLHVARKNSKNEWKNQSLLVPSDDINVLDMLIRKSTLFACSIPKTRSVSPAPIVPHKKGAVVNA